MRLVYGVLARPHYKTEYLEVPSSKKLEALYYIAAHNFNMVSPAIIHCVSMAHSRYSGVCGGQYGKRSLFS